jgi:hypothetical protein
MLAATYPVFGQAAPIAEIFTRLGRECHRVAAADGVSSARRSRRRSASCSTAGPIRDEVYHSTPIGWACRFRQSDSVDLLSIALGPMTQSAAIDPIGF